MISHTQTVAAQALLAHHSRGCHLDLRRSPFPASKFRCAMHGLSVLPQPTCPSCWPRRCRSAASTACQAPPEKRSSAPPLPRRTQGGRSSSGSSARAVSLVDTCRVRRAKLCKVCVQLQPTSCRATVQQALNSCKHCQLQQPACQPPSQLTTRARTDRLRCGAWSVMYRRMVRPHCAAANRTCERIPTL